MRELYSVLDQGYVKFIESWGSDEGIVEAARMSTAKGFHGWGGRCSCTAPLSHHAPPVPPNPACPKCGGAGEVLGDEKLLRYLYEHQHMTPFEMAGASFEIQAPIFVFREWHRHRTQSYNEMSGRYTVLPDMFYLPDLDRLKAARQSSKNKQGSELGFDEHQAGEIRETLERAYKDARKRYEILIDVGVAREVARLVLPVAQYSRMRASANLRNWLAFLSLRMHKTAQFEIRQFATAVGDLLQERFPRTYALFLEGK